MSDKTSILDNSAKFKFNPQSSKTIIIIKNKPIYDLFKRIFDIIFSFLGLVLLAIPFLIISLIIVIDSPGEAPIYRQLRVGKNGKKFCFYKFRSMISGAEGMLDKLLDENEMKGPAFKIKNDPRITKFGRLIRISSIDELPQLWNVLKGDMSLVGPRPPLPREVALYNDYQKQRLSVVPGITCFWQVQPKRNSLSFDQWLELDLDYINKRNLFVDLVVLFKTIRAVCGLEGE